MQRGKFITFEGIEGVGKTTNIDFLADLIEAQGHAVMKTREPGGTPIAEDIRNILKKHGNEPLPDVAELLLMFAARSINVNSASSPKTSGRRWRTAPGSSVIVLPIRHAPTRAGVAASRATASNGSRRSFTATSSRTLRSCWTHLSTPPCNAPTGAANWTASRWSRRISSTAFGRPTWNSRRLIQDASRSWTAPVTSMPCRRR